MIAALEVQNLKKSFPGFTLGPLSLELPAGYIMGFIGPNGAGKSTTIKCLLNLFHPDDGEIRVYGLDSHRDELEIRQVVGYVAETHPYYQDMTVAWTAGFYARLYRHWDDGLCRRLLEKFNVPRDRKIKELSKGTRAKLSLALALAHHPRLLILDEPMAGLDPIARHDVLQEMLAFIQDETRAIFFSTHIMEDVEKVADYVAVLNEGRLLLCQEKDDLLADWKGLAFPASRLEELKPWLKTWQQEGGRCLGVTGSYRDLLQQRPEAARYLEASPLKLEDLLLAAVRQGKTGRN
ncbi:ABC transporter ATP-binding protein [Neomoorella mulderi]|uniref:ABC transporter ATP-binding protein YtrB n=1 Tax=Moorella mulderi DSM 14980 TaxID=1122241 RepID=A0A151B093_9FIRM|nr:ABC transporter ATP-binding protein [Moorella mulderi]KYH33339.1 ABC transporter ATP-binding protein YtrB [Moorella mulderi DSM 14980]